MDPPGSDLLRQQSQQFRTVQYGNRAQLPNEFVRRNREQNFALGVPEATLDSLDALRTNGAAESKSVQYTQGVVGKSDSRAHLPQNRCALIYLSVYPNFAQRDRDRQPADSATDNDGFHFGRLVAL